VSCIGQQRRRVGDHAIAGLDDDKGGVERDADREGAAEIRRRMIVSVALAVTMIMIMAVAMIMMRVIVMRSVIHGRPCRSGQADTGKAQASPFHLIAMG
jgi:hypothetical protein